MATKTAKKSTAPKAAKATKRVTGPGARQTLSPDGPDLTRPVGSHVGVPGPGDKCVRVIRRWQGDGQVKCGRPIPKHLKVLTAAQAEKYLAELGEAKVKPAKKAAAGKKKMAKATAAKPRVPRTPVTSRPQRTPVVGEVTENGASGAQTAETAPAAETVPA